MTVETSANCNTLQDSMSKVATVTYYDRKNIHKLVQVIFFKSTINPIKSSVAFSKGSFTCPTWQWIFALKEFALARLQIVDRFDEKNIVTKTHFFH